MTPLIQVNYNYTYITLITDLGSSILKRFVFSRITDFFWGGQDQVQILEGDQDQCFVVLYILDLFWSIFPVAFFELHVPRNTMNSKAFRAFRPLQVVHVWEPLSRKDLARLN